MNLKITTLIENKADINNLLYCEHGLSLFIEIGNKKILFDTGQTGDFIKNAKKLNVDLNILDYVILSHGHYDHTGGFKKLVMETDKTFQLIVGKGFFNKKYKMTEEGYKFNGNSFDDEYIKKNNILMKIIDSGLVKLTEEIYVFSNFQRNNDFEALNNKFYIKQNDEFYNDNFLDEIVVGIKHQKGLVLLLGCSHIGLINIIETIIKRTGLPVYAIIGGSHLIHADELRLIKTINYLKESKIEILRLSHCTGEIAVNKLVNEFNNKFGYNNTGNIIKLDSN
jgi:7,8-dihydropterin-6-yl-methyl-4-(beta-D-ribofuranosyl)aminobenzene 5'-phosphate synthase